VFMTYENARRLAEKIWRECVVVCPHKEQYPCSKIHGHGLELDEEKVAQLILAHECTGNQSAPKLRPNCL